MKQLKEQLQPKDQPQPQRETAALLEKAFKVLNTPESPPAEDSGNPIVDHTIECVVRETVSLGLSMQHAQSLVRATLEAAGLRLTPDEVSSRIRSHALTYS